MGNPILYSDGGVTIPIGQSVTVQFGALICSLKIRATDATSGAPIAGAQVQIDGPSGASLVTDSAGLVTSGDVQLGTYTIQASHEALRTPEPVRVTLKAGENLLEVKLAPSDGAFPLELRAGADANTAQLVRNAWVFWRQGGCDTLLRTGGDGRIFSTDPSNACAEPGKPWDYTTPYKAQSGTEAQVFFCIGNKPLPQGMITADLYSSVHVGAAQAGLAAVTIEAPVVELTKPAELSLWPLLFTNLSEAAQGNQSYYTQGLNSGAALWNQGGLTVQEWGAAPAPAEQVRPKPRGLAIAGKVDAGATGVTIQILDRDGNPLSIRSAPASADVRELQATLAAPAAGKKPFKLNLFFADPAAALGPVQVFVRADGMARSGYAAFALHLLGAQLALRDEAAGGADGSFPGESDEKIVVDFTPSAVQVPQGTLAQALAALAPHTRARRLVMYDIAVGGPRHFDLPAIQWPGGAAGGANAPQGIDTRQSQMPLWMAELHFVGIARAQLEDLLLRRKHALAGAPTTLKLELDWKLQLDWRGPDFDAGNNPHSYSQAVETTQEVTFTLGDEGSIHGVDADGKVSGALSPAPARIPYPVQDRPVPNVLVSAKRVFGRQGGAGQDALVVQWQPEISDGGKEIIRGGNGRLTLQRLTIGGDRVDSGISPGSGEIASPPDLALPRFYIRGVNPSEDEIVDAIDAIVDGVYNDPGRGDWITLLTLDCWQQTCRGPDRRSGVVGTESERHQFAYAATKRSRFRGWVYGLQNSMPLFGPPHGYGVGQLDTPRPTDDQVWSFVHNIHQSVVLLMVEKGHEAYDLLKGHFQTPPSQRDKAAFQREVVRRYNGRGPEMRWHNGDWWIKPNFSAAPSDVRWEDPANPAKGANSNINYPNHALGTNVQYYTGAGAQTQFLFGPDAAGQEQYIQFNDPGDYGPGI